MKQFILIAYDAKDENAHARRMATRQAHVEEISRLRAEGKIICGVAITDDTEKMTGSVVVASFPSRAEFDKWLETEPYVVNNVWKDITVLNGSLGPSFADLLKKA
jgi:hypothetical protein